ncbi:hypothetical protein BC941DRAFT_426012 [Chlamydoabsidia padenii]|nr:hypothetical protein BC941DRAFT_426012 [Chlamydoabsidia padenii]
MSPLSTTGTLYVYGDSYSEITNSTRKTNGPIWSEQVAKAWGLQLQSFASLGSRTCRASDTASPSIASQVELYRNKVAHGNYNNKNDVHAFFIGITDITNSTKFEANNLVGCISQQITNLQQVDPQVRVLLLGIPPLEYSPFYANHTNHDQIKTRVEHYNVGLEDVVLYTKDDLKTPLSYIDTNQLFADILGNPAVYGLKDVDHAYWDQCQGRCSDSMDSYLWWDKIHLTGAGHKAIADTIIIKNPFGYTVDEDYVATNGDDSFLSSTGDYVHYAPWFLLFCVLVIVVMMMRPKQGFYFATLSLWKRRKTHAYTAVPV